MISVNDCRNMELKVFELYDDGFSYAELLRAAATKLEEENASYIHSIQFSMEPDDCLNLTVSFTVFDEEDYE